MTIKELKTKIAATLDTVAPGTRFNLAILARSHDAKPEYKLTLLPFESEYKDRAAELVEQMQDVFTKAGASNSTSSHKVLLDVLKTAVDAVAAQVHDPENEDIVLPIV